jgi:hypothetical protein
VRTAEGYFLKVESPRFRTYIVVESGGSITSDVTQRVLLGHVDFGGNMSQFADSIIIIIIIIIIIFSLKNS